MTVITAIIALLYVLMNLPKLKDRKIIERLFFNIIFIICISSFYWFSVFQTSITTNYEVYQSGKMATSESVAGQGLTLKQLIVTSNNERCVFEIGIHILIMICFTIAAFRRIIPKMKKEYIFFLILGIISTFMATKYFPWKFLGERVALIQFPWRMMTISNFCFTIICGINMGIVIKKFNFKDAVILCVISIIYAFVLKSFIPVSPNEITKVEDYESIGFVSGRVEDTLPGMGKSEYLPKNAYNNSFYIATRDKGVIILEGDGKIEDVQKNGNKLTFKLEVLEDETVIELPYIYYPGYRVTLDGSDIKAYENKNGFLTISLDEISKSDISVEYKGTNIMNYVKIFSIISFILFIAYVLIICESFKTQDNDLNKNLEN